MIVQDDPGMLPHGHPSACRTPADAPAGAGRSRFPRKPALMASGYGGYGRLGYTRRWANVDPLGFPYTPGAGLDEHIRSGRQLRTETRGLPRLRPCAGHALRTTEASDVGRTGG